MLQAKIKELAELPTKTSSKSIHIWTYNHIFLIIISKLRAMKGALEKCYKPK